MKNIFNSPCPCDTCPKLYDGECPIQEITKENDRLKAENEYLKKERGE